ncbi:hypothetical protein ACEN88_36045, partial [Massilia sp. CT11-108]|uniref:hypothetical protein n=1 Tax=Massilia sp. CT11-108 TaxID=3393900 RepID=UPI0039A55FF0
ASAQADRREHAPGLSPGLCPEEAGKDSPISLHQCIGYMEELFFFLAFFFFLNKEPSALRIRFNIEPPKLSLQVSMNGACYD